MSDATVYTKPRTRPAANHKVTEPDLSRPMPPIIRLPHSLPAKTIRKAVDELFRERAAYKKA